MSVLEYTAWKLLNVRAPIRLMVGYWDAQADVLPSHQALIDGIKAVTDKFRGESLIVVSANKAPTFANSADLAASLVVQRVP